MIAENVRNNESLTPEEMELLAAFRTKNFDQVGQVVGQRIAADEKQQERANKEHALEIISVELIAALDEIIDNFAYDLATQRGDTGRWGEEAAANDLLHNLAEFLIQAQIIDEDGAPMVKRHHLSDELFAHEFFDVSVWADGTLVSTKT